MNRRFAVHDFDTNADRFAAYEQLCDEQETEIARLNGVIECKNIDHREVLSALHRKSEENATLRAKEARLQAELDAVNVVVLAAHAILRESLDQVDVHPCDEYNDHARAKGLFGAIRQLYDALHIDPSKASSNASQADDISLLRAQIQDNEMGLEAKDEHIAVLQRRIAELEASLTESRANDRCSMQYLSQIREAAKHEGDFPSLVESVRQQRILSACGEVGA